MLDPIAGFINDLCLLGNDYSDGAQELYDAYCFYARQRYDEPISQKYFSWSLNEKGFMRKKTRLGYVYYGLKVKPVK